LYCPVTNLILPYSSDNLDDVKFDMDNSKQYLHLILPADRVNFLNGMGNFD